MAVPEKKTPVKPGSKEQDMEHAHQKYRGLINGELAKQLYFLQNHRKEEDKLDHDYLRFKNGTKDMRKKLSGARKKRKKAQATLATTEECHTILSQDTEIGKTNQCILLLVICNVLIVQSYIMCVAKHRADEMRQLMKEYKEAKVKQQQNVRHDIISLHGLEEDIASQVDKINSDICDINTAFGEWSNSTDESMAELEESRENCFAAFDDWSSLWPGVYSTLNTETSLTASAKTVATLQGVIGEWRALRATALSVKLLNTAMEAAARASVNDPSTQPYDYNEKLRKLQMSLMAKSLSLKSRTTTANNDITALNNLRKRLKSMLMDVSAAVESDMHFNIDQLEEQASLSLGERGKEQSARNTVRMHRNSDGTRVKNWLQHTILSGESTKVMDHVESIASQKVKEAQNSDERVKMFRGALHAKELETVRELLDINTEQFNYRQSTKPIISTDEFGPEAMTTVLAALECRKAFDDVQWAVEKYKAILSKNWTDAERDSLDPAYVERTVEKEAKREVDAQMASFNGWISYQLSARHLASGLNVAFPCPVDHLVKHAVAAAKDLSSRERPASSAAGVRAGRPKPSSGNHTPSNNMQKFAAQKAAEKHRAQANSPTTFVPEKSSTDLKPIQPVGPAPSASTPQRSKRVVGVLADHAPGSTPVLGARKASGSMIVTSSASLHKGTSSGKTPFNNILTSGGALDEDESDDNELETPRRLDESARTRLVGRGESVRSSMNRAMMEDSNNAAKLAEDSVDRTDRLLVHVTARIPFVLPAHKPGGHRHHHGHGSGDSATASEAMTVVLWWQDEEERLKVSIGNITGYVML